MKHIDSFASRAKTVSVPSPAAEGQQYCLVEASVNCALADFVLPGSTVFDVGSSLGELSAMMSRLVGPLGHVVAFEANPTTAARAVDVFMENGLFNIFMVNRAIATDSHREVTLHLVGAEGGVGDTLFAVPWAQAGEVTVRTLALDDFIDCFGVEPSFIKFDIEQAEALALRGLTRFLGRRKPLLIIEQGRDSFEAIEIVQHYGYHCIDLHNYRPFNTVADYPEDAVSVRNIACLHPQTLVMRRELSLYLDAKVNDLATYHKQDIEWEKEAAMFPRLDLAPGRYVMAFQVQVNDAAPPIYVGARDEANRFRACEHARAGYFSGGRVEIPFHLDTARPIRLTIASAGDFDISDAVAGATATLRRVEGFGRRDIALAVLGP